MNFLSASRNEFYLKFYDPISLEDIIKTHIYIEIRAKYYNFARY